MREACERTADSTLKQRRTPPFQALDDGTVKVKLACGKLASPMLSFFANTNMLEKDALSRQAQKR